MGRKPTTGKFKTREELVEAILDLHHSSAQKPPQIAVACGVSNPTVYRILEEHPRPKAKKSVRRTEPAKPTRQTKPAPRSTGETKNEGLWCWCFQKVEGFPKPFQGRITKDYGSRFELEVNRRIVVVNRGACSSNPYPEKKRE